MAIVYKQDAFFLTSNNFKDRVDRLYSQPEMFLFNDRARETLFEYLLENV